MKAPSLFRQPSFLKGIARTFDIFGTLDKSRYSQSSDAELIQSDWENIGEDFKQTLKKYAKKSYS
jgi:hypothetical protein